MPGIRDVATLTNGSILDLDTLPEHLVVVGGSYIGLEFAQMFRRFGAEVTVVEKGPRLIGREDADVSGAVADILAAEGIALRLGAECIRFAPRGAAIAVGVDCADGAPEVIGSHVLLAIGRRPNTDDLGLEAAGVATDARGYIAVDDALAHHRSPASGRWATATAAAPSPTPPTTTSRSSRPTCSTATPAASPTASPAYALYTDPPLGRVGMTEAEARASGRRVLIGRRAMTEVGRARSKKARPRAS